MSGKNSAYDLILSPKAVKQLQQIERREIQKIRQSLLGLTAIPPRGDIKKLKGFKGRFRLRVGDWRIIFFYDTKKKEVLISEILPRSKAY